MQYLSGTLERSVRLVGIDAGHGIKVSEVDLAPHFEEV
jgi:hypothetical protein